MYHEWWAGLGVLFLLLWLAVVVISIAILVMSIVATVQAYQAGREGWWIYLIFVFTVPLAGVVMWFFITRNKPIMSNGKPFM